jgi:hypothetical protein
MKLRHEWGTRGFGVKLRRTGNGNGKGKGNGNSRSSASRRMTTKKQRQRQQQQQVLRFAKDDKLKNWQQQG